MRVSLAAPSYVRYSGWQTTEPWTRGSTEETISNALKDYNVVVVVLPYIDLDQNEKVALVNFVQGFQKRILLVGENTSIASYVTSNGYLNNLAQQLGMNARFEQHNLQYDQYASVACPVKSSNYLMSGVTYLYDYVTSRIEDARMTGENPWLYDRPDVGALAAIHDLPSQSWIVEEDGNKVAIADSSLFYLSYAPAGVPGTTLTQNALFVRNLCSIW